MKKPNMNNTLRIKIFKVLIILTVLILYIYFKNYSTFIHFDTDQPISVRLRNGKIWMHLYFSVDDLLTLITDYNNKFDACLYLDLITELVDLKESIVDLINSKIIDSNFSDFFDSSENANHIYMTFLEDLNNVRVQDISIRLLIYNTYVDEPCFQANFIFLTEVYLKFLRSLIRVLALVPNAYDPDLFEVIKKSVDFANKLEEILKN